MTKLKQVSATDYANRYYREYSIYINNSRAIPSVVDGFKPVQRKALFSAIKNCRNDFMKVSALSGTIISEAAYHHGDVSAQDAIVKMAQDFNNNVPFFEGDGTFGTRLSPEAGAPRYVFVKLSEHYNNIFKDTDIAPHSIDVSDHPEPLYYLPIIPTVLLNGVQGVAIGFATNILPRSAKDLAQACIEYLKEGKIKNKLKPYFEGFRGTVEALEDPSKFIYSGILTKKSKTKLHITELPIGTTHEKYQEHLNKLLEKKVIVGYIDNSDSNYDFEITLPNNNSFGEERLRKEFKIETSVTENIVVVNDFNYEEGRTDIAITTYGSVEDVVKDFVDFRIRYYEKRIKTNISRIESEIEERENKIMFINDVLSKKIKIGDLTRKDLIQFMKDSKKYNPDYVERIISMSIYNMTKDNMEKLKSEIETLKEELVKWNKATSKKLYIQDLEFVVKTYN